MHTAQDPGAGRGGSGRSSGRSSGRGGHRVGEVIEGESTAEVIGLPITNAAARMKDVNVNLISNVSIHLLPAPGHSPVAGAVEGAEHEDEGAEGHEGPLCH